MTHNPSYPYKNTALLVSERVEDLLGRMTTEEKLAQLSAAWLLELSEGEQISSQNANKRIPHGVGQITRPAGGGSLKPGQVAGMMNAIQSYLIQQTRLGIPAIVHEECCSGFMARGATLFPQIIGLASTWEPMLAYEMTSVIRAQMRAVGAHQGLAPVLDLARDPRWGRLEETFGEDPYLAARMGAAYVRGLQGEDLSQGVVATGKHFAAHGLPEGGLNWAPVHVGERELREAFLFPFEAAVRQVGLASIMNAYHELDGVPCAASYQLLTEILREEWGFDGIVVSDYNAVVMLADYHQVAANKEEAARLALQAGIDVELPGTDCYGEPLRQALESGKLSLAVVDQAVRRVLALKFRLGLFDNPYVNVDGAAQVFDTADQRALARRIAQKSLVLLKNSGGILPLSPNLSSIAVIGPNADAVRRMAGDYAYASVVDLMEGGEKPPELTRFPERMPPTTSILNAIRHQVSPQTTVRYAPGCDTAGDSRAGFPEALEITRTSDVAILVMGGRSGLTEECTSGELRDRAKLGLPGVQEELVRAVLETGTPIVLVLVDGRPVAIPELAEQVPAILDAWLPGEEGGLAVAQALFGEINPGGKLPVSFPRSSGQVPVYYRHKPSGGRSFMFNDYVDLSVRPLFPFGHGLSYTSFEYGDLKINPAQVNPEGEITIEVRVKNNGERAGDEVVQLYVHDAVASLTRPVMELKGFQRVTLSPGESCKLTFILAAAQLAFYDHDMRYILEPGKIEVMLGSSSEDIRLRGSFEIVGQVTPVAKKVFFSQTSVG